MKTTNIKKSVHPENSSSWFDSKNARYIVLCATLGIFGAHKFAQHKYFQGIFYILLDLTVFGIILTVILSWLDLIFLTAKSDNRPGNMILGSIFILFESFVLIPQSSSLVIKNISSEPKDMVITIEEKAVLDDDTEQIVAKAEDDDAPISKSDTIDKVLEMPLFVTESGDVPTRVTVEKDNSIMLMVGSDTHEETPKKETIESKPVVSVEPVKEPAEKAAAKEPVQPKVVEVPKQAKNDKASSDDKNQDTDDDFGSFSLYGMIAGE